MSVSPNRRHVNARVVQRRWEDVSEWPFQFVILPVLVAFAFCLVLFLGSKHGTRLAAFRTWFPTNMPCRSGTCIQTVTVDSEGGLVAGLSSVVPSGSGAFSGITGLLRLDTTRGAEISAPNGLDGFGVMPLSPDDLLKYNFNYWLLEGEKLAGQQSKDCDANYGTQYLEKWRKARVDWCTVTASDTSTAPVSSQRKPAADGPALVQRGALRRRLRGTTFSNGSNNKTVTGLSPPPLPVAGSGGGAGKSAVARAPSKSPSSASERTASSPSRGSAVLGAAVSHHSDEPTVPSSFSLYPFHDKDAYLVFGVASNTVLDSRSFLGSLPHGMPESRRGSYAAACHVGTELRPGAEFMGLESVRRWTKDSLKTDEYDKVSRTCAPILANGSVAADGKRSAVGLVEHPVLLLSRLDSTNAFRTVEELLSTFTALAVLRDVKIARGGLQVVLADGKPNGLYLDLWASLSRPYPLRILSQQPWPTNTCLTHAVHNMYGGSSILTSMGVAKKTTCKSSVVMAASLWLRHMLGPAIQSPLRSAFGGQRQNSGVVRKYVVWISRRNFEGLAQNNLTSWQNQRRFENEGEVVLELQREIWRWNDEACVRNGLKKSFGSSHRRRRQQQLRRLLSIYQLDGNTAAASDAHAAVHARNEGMDREMWEVVDDLAADQDDFTAAIDNHQDSIWQQQQEQHRQLQGMRCRASNVFFDLRVVELNDIPFYPDHVQILGQATVLAGAHGSGLANMIWMSPGKSGVLELHHNSAGNDHYHNQAHLLGHKYVNVDSDGDRVELAAAAAGLRKLLDMLGTA